MWYAVFECTVGYIASQRNGPHQSMGLTVFLMPLSDIHNGIPFASVLNPTIVLGLGVKKNILRLKFGVKSYQQIQCIKMCVLPRL